MMILVPDDLLLDRRARNTSTSMVLFLHYLLLGLSRKNIFQAVKASLKRLNMDYIDVLKLHRYDPEISREETIKALHGMLMRGISINEQIWQRWVKYHA